MSNMDFIKFLCNELWKVSIKQKDLDVGKDLDKDPNWEVVEKELIKRGIEPEDVFSEI